MVTTCSKMETFIIYFCSIFLMYPVFAQAATRVYGGHPTSIETFPIVAQLLLDPHGHQLFAQHCAGVVLTSRHVVSAAHCFQYNESTKKDYSQTRFWQVRVGSTYRSRGGSVYNLEAIIAHPAFDPTYLNNDVAMLVVDRPFTFNSRVRQGTITKQNLDIDRGTAVFVGWGVTKDGVQSEQLQVATLNIISPVICRERYSNISARVTESMICAGDLDQGGKDGCFGDSGGPLMYNGVVIGLMSFGYTCGHNYYPGVYTKLSHFSNWILETVYANKF